MRKLALVALLAVACGQANETDGHQVTTVGPLGADVIATDVYADPHIGPGRAAVQGTSLRISTDFDFGPIVVGTRATARLVVTNAGPAPTSVDAIEVLGFGFSLDHSSCPPLLPVNDSCKVVVNFVPLYLGGFSGTLRIASLSAATITNLSGTGGWRLNVVPTAAGAITSTPAGIQCGASCTGIFVGDVTLTFVPSAPPPDVRWSVPGCTGLTCTVPATLPSATVSVATHAVHEITVIRAGAGQGSVASTPAGIACGASCTAQFLPSDVVALTATPAPGSVFGGWSDPSCGSSATCQIPAGTGATFVTATFRVAPEFRSITISFVGPGSGEVVAFQGGAVVARCQRSCTMSVSQLETVIAAETPYQYGSALPGTAPLLGPGCDGDRCTIAAGAAPTSISADFFTPAQDDWSFFGDPGEEFTTGAFDSANHLIASSQQRMIKLDLAGQLEWSLPPVSNIVAGPGAAFYTWTAAGGTEKRDAAGNVLWTFPGTLQTVDLVTGNVLVHPSASTMALLRPDGTPIWTAPGQGTDIDDAGIVYEPYSYLGIPNPTQELESYVYLRAHRYSAAGVPIADDPKIWTGDERLVGPYATGFRVSADRVAAFVAHQGEINGHLWLYSASASASVSRLLLHPFRYNTLVFRARLAAASQGVFGLLHDQMATHLSFNYWDYDYTFGFHFFRIARDGTWWEVSRFAPARFAEGHGVAALAIAGGATDRFAVLGWYRPVGAAGVSSGPDRGVIQAFRP